MVLALTLAFVTSWPSPVQVAPAASQDAPRAPPRVVLISGEDEYDSEVSLSALAHLLAERHGMTTTLASSHSPDSVHGLDPLASADLAILFVRSRAWPEADSKRVDDFLARGGSFVALRTSSHAFAYPADSPLAAENDSFGPRLFGTPWQWDHGRSSSTDVVITPRPRNRDDHELLGGVPSTFHVRSWLVHVLPLPDDVHVIARGTPVDSERDGKSGEPGKEGGGRADKSDAKNATNLPDANPVAWTRLRPDGGRTFYTSMGHPEDFEVPAFRRLLVNGILWTLNRSASADRRVPPIPAPVATNEDSDLALPVTKPLTDFQISTAYVSDWTRPIESQHFPSEEGIAGFNDVQWIPFKSQDGAVDLRRFDPTSSQGTIYVRTTLHLATAHDLELVLQSDDGVELFVDRKSRFAHQELRTLLAGCDCVPLSLAAGDHELMFKVMNAGDAWALRARVRDLTEYREGAKRPK